MRHIEMEAFVSILTFKTCLSSVHSIIISTNVTFIYLLIIVTLIKLCIIYVLICETSLSEFIEEKKNKNV